MSRLCDFLANGGKNRAQREIELLERLDPELFGLQTRLTGLTETAKFVESIKQLTPIEAYRQYLSHFA
jgi:hypothetical protein